MSETNWRTDWPNWSDIGSRVEVEIAGGRVLLGTLTAPDFFFDGEDEVPLFEVENADGTSASFATMDRWRVRPA